MLCICSLPARVLHLDRRVPVQELKSVQNIRMAPSQSNNANKPTPIPTSKQKTLPHTLPTTSSPKWGTRSSDIAFIKTQNQSTQRHHTSPCENLHRGLRHNSYHYRLWRWPMGLVVQAAFPAAASNSSDNEAARISRHSE